MRLYQRGKFWWIQTHDKRVSTGCTDELAAQIFALGYQRAEVIIAAMKSDPALREQVECYVDDCRKARASGFIYGMRVGDMVKIGFTSQAPEKRARGVRTSQAAEVVVVALQRGTRADERALHAHFRHAHVRGEWFRADDSEVAAWVEKYRYRTGPTSTTNATTAKNKDRAA